MKITRLTAGILIAILSVGAIHAADRDTPAPRKLVSLVGDDVGLCLELRELTRQSRQFSKSELFGRLKASKIAKSLLESKPFAQLQNANRQLRKKAGDKPVDRLLSDLFGHSVVLAVYPRASGKPAGVLLTRATDPKTLDAALKLWNRLQPGSMTKTLTYGGRSYFCRSQGMSDPPLYYVRVQDVFALSDREEMIQKVLRFSGGARAANESPLTESKKFRAARKSLSGDPLLTAFLNPTAWGEALSAKRPGDPEFPLVFWKNCRWAMASVRLDGGFVLQAVLDYDGKSMPLAWQRYVRAASQKSEMLDHIPAAALVAYVGRFDPVLLRSLFVAAEKEPGGESLRKARTMIESLAGISIADGLIPKLRSEFGYYVVGRDRAPQGTPPFHALFAFAVKKPENAKAADKWRGDLERGLANVVLTLTGLYNLNLAKGGVDLPPFGKVKSKRVGKTGMHWIDPVAGLQPGFALGPQFLIFASSPDLMAAFVAKPGKDRLVDDALFREARRRFFPEENQMLYVNVERLRGHLKKHSKSLQKFLVKVAAIPPQARPLQSALDVMGIVDGAFLATRITDSRIQITLGVVAKPAEQDRPR